MTYERTTHEFPPFLRCLRNLKEQWKRGAFGPHFVKKIVGDRPDIQRREMNKTPGYPADGKANGAIEDIASYVSRIAN